MQPIQFEGSTEIKKPEKMTDEECLSAWARYGLINLLSMFEMLKSNLPILPPFAAGLDAANYSYFLTAWKPSYEDLQALNRGEPVYVKTLCTQLPPMALFTLDEENKGNF